MKKLTVTTYDANRDMPLAEQVAMVADIFEDCVVGDAMPLIWQPHVADAMVLLRRQQAKIERLEVEVSALKSGMQNRVQIAKPLLSDEQAAAGAGGD